MIFFLHIHALVQANQRKKKQNKIKRKEKQTEDHNNFNNTALTKRGRKGRRKT